jgi:hypothetical protein
VDEQSIRESFVRHGALAQMHRWWQFYEVAEPVLENQLDILAEDVFVRSTLGEVTGRAAYVAASASLPTDWRNSHAIGRPAMTVTDGGVSLRTDLTYLNLGAKPAGELTARRLQYDVEMSRHDHTPLPTIRRLVISDLGDPVGTEYRSAYPQNRVLSLLHYWLALIEDPARRAEPFAELLTDPFRLDFTSGPITDAAGLAGWLAGPASEVEASTHVITSLAVDGSGAGSGFTAVIGLDWQAVLPGGAQIQAATEHTWQVVDDPERRFARIRHAEVRTVRPVGPA